MLISFAIDRMISNIKFLCHSNEFEFLDNNQFTKGELLTLERGVTVFKIYFLDVYNKKRKEIIKKEKKTF